MSLFPSIVLSMLLVGCFGLIALIKWSKRDSFSGFSKPQNGANNFQHALSKTGGYTCARGANVRRLASTYSKWSAETCLGYRGQKYLIAEEYGGWLVGRWTDAKPASSAKAFVCSSTRRHHACPVSVLQSLWSQLLLLLYCDSRS